MVMTLVREDDDAATIARRLGNPEGPLSIDAIVVDVMAARGVDAATLRAALIRHRPDFRPSHKEPVRIPGGEGIELYGTMTAREFRMDRIVVGDVTCFGTDGSDIHHVTDYGPMRHQDHKPSPAAVHVGLNLCEVLSAPEFQSDRSPLIRGAMITDNGAVHLEVDRQTIAI